jgi:hypothetical protein
MLSVFGVDALDLPLASERSSLLKRVALVNTIWLKVMTTNPRAISLWPHCSCSGWPG